MSARPSPLHCALPGLLSQHCEVSRDGVPLTRTGTIWFPLRCGFTVDGREWVVAPHVPGGRGIDLVREIAMGGALARPCFGLSADGAAPVATARARGFFDGGYDLMMEGSPARLDVERDRQAFTYSGPGGTGRCELRASPPGAAVDLPPQLPLPQQVFIALLAMRNIIRLRQAE